MEDERVEIPYRLPETDHPRLEDAKALSGLPTVKLSELEVAGGPTTSGGYWRKDLAKTEGGGARSPRAEDSAAAWPHMSPEASGSEEDGEVKIVDDADPASLISSPRGKRRLIEL
ncbi:hypothetical protein DL765_006323 [Monosporascus sp. GIB2]|nr:hypothetical protein DL765_006323 [Monosporascus sp. GIB2]